jgi:hypothetical protein
MRFVIRDACVLDTSTISRVVSMLFHISWCPALAIDFKKCIEKAIHIILKSGYRFATDMQKLKLCLPLWPGLFHLRLLLEPIPYFHTIGMLKMSTI